MDRERAIAEVKKCEEERTKALVAADVAALDRLFDDDLIHIHSTARIDSKASYLDAVKSGRSRYLSAERAEMDFAVHDRVVIVSSRIIYGIPRPNGEIGTLDNRNLSVWMAGKDGWKLVSSQSTKMPAA